MSKNSSGMPRGAVWLGSIILGCLAAAVVWSAAPRVFGDGPVPITQESEGLVSKIDSLLGKSVATSTEIVVKESPLKVVPGNDERFFKLSDGKEWNIVLRQANGEPYSEIIILGMIGEKTAIVSGRTDMQAILRVERSGAIRELYRIPENTVIVGFAAESVWLASFVPGEGLESDPAGPSNLIRVDAEGHPNTVLTDKRVIVSVKAESKDHGTYTTDDGQAVVY